MPAAFRLGSPLPTWRCPRTTVPARTKRSASSPGASSWAWGRGASEESLGKAIDGALALARVLPSAVKEVRSIDLKRDEQGLLGLARHRGWPLRFFSSDELAAVPGDFPASAFVERVAGVDNVCERAAAAQGEAVILPKTIIEGAAVAVSLDECPIRWNEE